MEILDVIRRIAASKAERRVFPEHALSIEVAELTGMGVDEVEEAAADLEKEGKVRSGRAMNYRYYRLL